MHKLYILFVLQSVVQIDLTFNTEISNPLFQSHANSIYMYGDMDYDNTDSWQIERDDIILQATLKSGSFADIKLATMRSTNKKVVAKLLKRTQLVVLHKQQLTKVILFTYGNSVDSDSIIMWPFDE